MNKPSIGDTVTITSTDYTGPATVTFIDEERLYQAHFLPIQCAIDPSNFDRLPSYYPLHGVMRVSLNDLAGAPESPAVAQEELDFSQQSLF